MNQDNYTLEMFKSLSEDEKSGEDIVRESTSYWKDAWKKFKKDPLALIGLVIIAVLIVFAIFGPMISPYTYDKQDY